MKKELIVIDIQKEYITKGRPFNLNGIETSLEKAKEMLEYARKNNWKIHHVKHLQEGEIFNKDSIFSDYIQGFTPLQGEKEYIKNNYSSYTNKEFEKYMLENKEKNFHIIGYGSNMCVLSTIVDGYHRGNKFVFVSDASFAKAEDDMEEEELHHSMCITLKRFSKVVKIRDII